MIRTLLLAAVLATLPFAASSLAPRTTPLDGLGTERPATQPISITVQVLFDTPPIGVPGLEVIISDDGGLRTQTTDNSGVAYFGEIKPGHARSLIVSASGRILASLELPAASPAFVRIQL